MTALGPHGVERAADSMAADLEYMRVDHRGGDIGMPQQILHRMKVVAGL